MRKVDREATRWLLARTALGLSLLSLALNGFALSTSEYYALAPELASAINTAWALTYTVSTGSLIAFYYVGWSAPYLARLAGFLLFLTFISGTLLNLRTAVHTWFESQFLFFSSENICSADRPIDILYRSFDHWVCIRDWSKQEEIELAVSLLTEARIIGGGHSGAGETNLIQNFDILSHNVFNSVVVAFCLLVWLLAPSKAFCARRGWLKED